MNKNRNRHTGHINAFKKAVMERGKIFTHRGKRYSKAAMGMTLGKVHGVTVVRHF